MMRNTPIAVLSIVLLTACIGNGAEPDVPAEATVDGKYSKLLRTIAVPQDKATYGHFCDYGYNADTDWAGYENLPPGYWVYVAPNWYVWGHSTELDEPVLTVDGPEAENLLREIQGQLVIGKAYGEIRAISLPSNEETIVRPDDVGDEYAMIHAISGPDRDGWIAFIEDHFFVDDEKDRKHALKLIKVDGTGETEIFSRPGATEWGSGSAIGQYIALSPFGQRVALITDQEPRQMPRALLGVGTLKIWDAASKRTLNVETIALNERMSWFPDGKRLAYVRLVRRNGLPESAPGVEVFGQYFGEWWDEIPAIYVLNIETGASSFAHVGWAPVVSSDGNSIFVGGWDNNGEFTWNRFQLDTRETTRVTWPGDAMGSVEDPTGSVDGAVAVISDKTILYWGLPTTGHAKHSGVGGPMRPTPLLTIKAADITSHRFQTIVDVDPRGRVSFGAASNEPR